MYKMTKTQLAAILGIKDVTIEDVLNEIDYAKLLGQTCSGIDDALLEIADELEAEESNNQ